MNSTTSLLDFKKKQLQQARQKRKILEETLAGTSAETELLQTRLKNLQLRKDKLDQEFHERQRLRDIFSGREFQEWWNDGVLQLLETSKENSKRIQHQQQEEAEEKEFSECSGNFHQLIKTLSHLRQSHKKYCCANSSFSSSSALKNSSFTTTTNSATKHYNPLLKEATAMLNEMRNLEASSTQTQTGPLSQLEERHRQLDSAIADAKRKTLRLNVEADRQERLILIERYKSEIPQLRQELATRPKASDVAEFKQRMIDQIQMLSSEMNEVLGELQLFEKREEVEQELENQIREGEALRIEIASLQEQDAGLVEFAADQKENIRQWNETEKPRHESFIANLEKERDQLKRELKMFNIPANKNGNDNDDAENNSMKDENNNNNNDDDGLEIIDVAASPRRVVHVVHFDGSVIQEVETKRAPTKRWHRSAKFISSSAEGATSTNLDANNKNENQNDSGALSTTHHQNTGGTFMLQALKILTDIYVPPMVEFTSTVDEKTGHRKDDRTEAASITVRMLSKLSSWMFGESSWVERGRKNKKKPSVDVVV